jgi:hypothetical protein
MRGLKQTLSSIKWDLRIVLGLLLLLAVLAGFTFAAPGDTKISFDFGGAAVSDQAAGMIAVKGAASAYPTTSAGVTFGWTNPGAVQVFTSPTVTDKMKKDANGGTSANTFVISGLTPGGYTVSATVGSAEESFTTTMKVGSDARSTTSAPGSWRTLSVSANTLDGTIWVDFSGAGVWAVNGLDIIPGQVAQPASFNLSVAPATASLAAGETGSFQISVTPLNEYDGNVSLAVSGLAGGITAELSPAVITTLPGTATLRLRTEKDTPGVAYSILLRATGDDTNTVTKNAVVNLSVQASGQSPVAAVEEEGEEQPTPEAVDPKKIAADQALLDKFAADQAEVVVNRNNFLELRQIDTDIVGHIPAVELPAPSTPFEGVLQRLTGSGIISIAAETAPDGLRATPEKASWWQALVQAVFKRAN